MLKEHFQKTLQQFLSLHCGVETVVVAYSGGVDSSVLLHLCAQSTAVFPSLTFKAIHVDHQLQAESAQWRMFCQQTAKALSIDLLTTVTTVQNQKKLGVEQAARNARLAAFKQVVDSSTLLLTAHHQEDQAETFLLQLFRGAGPKGLSAMPAIKPFGKGHMGRPLLTCSKAEIVDYAAQHDVQWIEDMSNQETRFDRNFIRHELMPRIQQRWPSVQNSIARSASLCAETSDLLQSELSQWDVDFSTKRLTIPLGYSDEQCAVLLRHWLQVHGIRTPSQKIMTELVDLLSVRDSSKAVVCVENVDIRHFNRSFYLVPALPVFDATQTVHWQNRSETLPRSLGAVSTQLKKGCGISFSTWQASKVTVQFRSGGERLQLLNRAGSRTLKNLYQEWEVLPWVRPFIPLIFLNGQLAAVAHFCVDERFLAAENEEGVRIQWEQSLFDCLTS